MVFNIKLLRQSKLRQGGAVRLTLSPTRLGVVVVAAIALVGAGCQCAPAPPPPPPPDPPASACDQIVSDLPNRFGPPVSDRRVGCSIGGFRDSGWDFHVSGDRRVRFGPDPTSIIRTEFRGAGIVDQRGEVWWQGWDEQVMTRCFEQDLTGAVRDFLGCAPVNATTTTLVGR